MVYKAWQADLERTVALKFLHSDSQESTERFIREAKIAANLAHPNITTIHEVGQHEGKLYITMQFVDGVPTHKGSFKLREAVQIIRDAATAVDFAHARDIIHRDIKPHNIMVTQERSGTEPAEMARRTYVMDFGLARSASKGGTLTTEGQVMGTPSFMSPEQAEGRTCDARSDVYALGATLYALATGRAPFEANTPIQVLMKVAHEAPVAPSKLNPQIDTNLESVILKSMAKNPDERYPTAGRLTADLNRWLQGQTTDAGPTVQIATPHSNTALKPSEASPAPAPPKSRAAAFAAIIAIFVAVAGALAVFMLKSDPAGKSGAAVTPVPPPIRKETPPAPPPAVVAPPVATPVIEITTRPTGATVRVEGYRGEWTTPCRITNQELPPDEHTLVISRAGYETLRETVVVVQDRPPLMIERTLKKPTRKVAFTIDSKPRGARILLDGARTAHQTPYTVYRDDVNDVRVRVELELPGYISERRTVQIAATPQDLVIDLAPQTGTFSVRGAAPGAKLLLFRIPSGLRNPAAALTLWSENRDALRRGLAALEARDAGYVSDRLGELSRHDDGTVREGAAALAAGPPAADSVALIQSTRSDSDGNGLFEGVPVLHRYRVLGTSSAATDFISDPLQPHARRETVVRAEMTGLVLVRTRMRPSVGRFDVLLAGDKLAGQIAPDGPGLRVPAGPVRFRFVPPPGDDLLKPFEATRTVDAGIELTGNLYYHSALRAREDGDRLAAVGGFTRVLQEQSYPGEEESLRAPLPELIRTLYREEIRAAESKGKSLPGDLLEKAAKLRGQPPARSISLLLEVYAAKNADPRARGAAASTLAVAHARLRRPYEAMEWMERAVAENVDPGGGAETEVGSAVRKMPGLKGRWNEVTLALARLRRAAVKPAAKKPPPPPPPPAGAELGVVQGVHATLGVFVRLAAGARVAPRQALETFRDGKVVATLRVQKVTKPDATYPHGAAVCTAVMGAPLKGDRVRASKK